MKVNRRDFIQRTTLLGGGLALGLGWPIGLNGNEEEGETTSFSPNLLMELGTDGIVHFKYTRHEMGQGSFTGLSMIFANELGAAWDKVEAKQVDFSLDYDPLHTATTGGSSTIKLMWPSLRDLAATARMMLIAAAAKQWKVAEGECIAEESQVIHQASGQKIGFGDLVKLAGEVPIPKKLVYKDPKDYKIVGQRKKNLNLHKIIAGELPYSMDVKVPHMAYAAIARSPIYLGRIQDFDDSEARKVKGYIATIAIRKREVEVIDDFSAMREGVAVLAENTWAAFEAKKRLKIIWSGELEKASTADYLELSEAAKKEAPSLINYHTGTVEEQLAKATKTFSRSYTMPYKAHAIMETPSAVADYREEGCEIWSSVQNVKRVLERVGKAVERPIEAFTFHNLSCGGSFGRRFYDDFVTEAVYLSKLAKRPVKVVWSREDDISTGGYHCLHEETHTIGLDEENAPLAWKQQTLRASNEEGLIWAYSASPYYNENRIHEINALQAQLPLMAWRSVAAYQNAFGRESFIDELAHELGLDPLKFRLDLIKQHIDPKTFGQEYSETRMKWMKKYIIPGAERVFNKMQELEDWTKALAPGHGRGVAGHSFGETFVGQLVEVAVVDGFPEVLKVICVVDCGRVINPHQATGQIEGGVIWALSTIYYNQITVENGRVQQSNFHDYPVLRMDKTPEIEVVFIESEERPLGVGEPGVPPLAPAVMNAIFAATGKRIRDLPIKKEDFI